jgi:hypothetical protein
MIASCILHPVQSTEISIYLWGSIYLILSAYVIQGYNHLFILYFDEQ